MFRKQYDDDIKPISQPKHIKKVWQTIESGHDKYLKLALEEDPLHLDGLAALGTLKRSAKSQVDSTHLVNRFMKAIDSFQSDADSYRTFFDPDSMVEYGSSPGAFKPALNKGCPIIRNTLRSQSEELLEWRKKYNLTQSRALLDMFTNLVDFHTDYIKATKPGGFSKFDRLSDFDFGAVEDDEECRIEGVIGMGIKSTILHHLTPMNFPPRDRHSLLGFYLLSDCDAFGLPSESSEFVMYDPEKKLKDGTCYSAHNFWYPYALFTLYSLRLYRRLKTALTARGVELDDHYRFVYTQTFLHQVCQFEKEKISTFVAHDVLHRFTEV